MMNYTNLTTFLFLVSAQQYKPVRPASVGKGGFFYPDSSAGSISKPETSPLPTQSLKPRRLVKFTAPSRIDDSINSKGMHSQ